MKLKKITAKFSEYFGETGLSAFLLRLMGNLRVDHIVEPVYHEELIRTGVNNFQRINLQSFRIREWLEKHKEQFSLPYLQGYMISRFSRPGFWRNCQKMLSIPFTKSQWMTRMLPT